MNKIIIRDEIYECDFVFIYNTSNKDFKEYLEESHKGYEHTVDAGKGLSLTIEHEGVNTYKYLFVEKFDHSVDSYCTLVHEVFHVISSNLERAGIKHCEKTEEAYAYYYEYILKKILSHLEKEKCKKKKAKSKKRS